MKEAAGEANMTVITIVLIGIVLAAGAILIPNMLSGSNSQADCAAKGNVWYNSKCYTPDKCTSTGGKYKCS